MFLISLQPNNRVAEKEKKKEQEAKWRFFLNQKGSDNQICGI